MSCSGVRPFSAAQHHHGAVGVVRRRNAPVAAHALVTHPDVGLDVAHQVAEVDVAAGVGQGIGDENGAGMSWVACVQRDSRSGTDC